ncbi:aspartate/ornithine carbamoyltransferase family protein [Thiorhodospira sibirica]|uniref:aspartate/ornithine carbamoyltransferase family protein n=1 Tax=Thiorhodospira sibirica TaxID=154347 RepID=UPI00022C4677|nr:aspartate carbamoyltransferase [Thiorhodospira sibirica]
MVVPPDVRLQKTLRPKDGTAGIERPKALLDALPEDPRPLMALSSRHVVSARAFDRATLVQLFRLAAQYESTPQLMHMPLSGKILISAFYEPSTRTRLSFESAWHRLGGDIMSITDPATTGMAKGESLADIAEMFNNYGDVIVLRNNEDHAIYEMLDALRIPIINAGNGIDEHPTQAMADLYTIFKWRPQLLAEHVPPAQHIRIGVIGVPGRMRTVRSLLLMLGQFSEVIAEVVVICDEAAPFSAGQAEELAALGLKVRISKQLDAELPALDVVYINAIAWVGDTFEAMGKNLRLSAASPLKPDAIILHPLARGEELATDLDATPHNWYFAQARGAVFIRMALLTCTVRRVSEVMDTPLS